MPITRESMLATRTGNKKVSVAGYPDVYIRCLTRAEIDLTESLGAVADKQNCLETGIAAFRFALSMVDETGKRIFTDGHELEVNELDYPWFREIAKVFADIHFPEPTIQQIAQDSKN